MQLAARLALQFFSQNGITNVDLSHPLTDSDGRLRILFAGEATDGSYYGTVHGAMNSAEREVNRLSKANCFIK